MTFYQYPDYMYHYGVKGMKWGVRRAKINNKRQTNRRKKYLNKTSKKMNENSETARGYKKEIDSYKRAGLDHYKVVDSAKKNARKEADQIYDLSDSIFGKTTSESSRSNLAKEHYLLNGDRLRKEAYNELVNDAEDRYSFYKNEYKKWESANEQVKKLPLNSSNKDYRKAIKQGKKIIG